MRVQPTAFPCQTRYVSPVFCCHCLRALELRQSSFVATSSPDGGGVMWGERAKEGARGWHGTVKGSVILSRLQWTNPCHGWAHSHGLPTSSPCSGSIPQLAGGHHQRSLGAAWHVPQVGRSRSVCFRLTGGNWIAHTAGRSSWTPCARSTGWSSAAASGTAGRKPDSEGKWPGPWSTWRGMPIAWP